MNRWNLSIPPTTDRIVRKHLAERGFKKGDLSRFVDHAVRERNAGISGEEVDAEIAAAVDEARADRP